MDRTQGRIDHKSDPKVHNTTTRVVMVELGVVMGHFDYYIVDGLTNNTSNSHH